MGEEHSATTFFSVSLPPFSRSVFFGRVIEVRDYTSNGIDWCGSRDWVDRDLPLVGNRPKPFP